MPENPQSGGQNRRDFLGTLLASSAVGALALGKAWPFRAAQAASSAAEPAPEGADIAHVRVYPALGICRVGGSPKWFLAPEIPGLPPEPDGTYKTADFFKDGDYRIKRQAQRFRVYAFDAENRVIGEVTEAQARITWQVGLANTKAAWYGFNNPLDNGALAPGLPGQKRNQYIVPDRDRQAMLIVDGGTKEISGRAVNPDGQDARHRLVGQFWNGTAVPLGTLSTDPAGRLIVIPAEGLAGSPSGAPITSFADNDGWYDDWCDGPVAAMVTLADGRTLEAESAWVACVGPNFAPEIPPITTLYDVVEDLNVAQGWTPADPRPLSFRKHIYPTLRRVALMAWLTDAAHLREGWMEIGDFGDPDFVKRLADPGAEAADLRKAVFAQFRNPGNNGPEAFRDERLKIPYMLGDGVNYNGSPLQWFQFPKLQYARLQAWADGDFLDDFDQVPLDGVTALEDLPLAEQPAALTEAALEPCSGGAFHPGVELTYVLRNAALYARHHDATREPFRLAQGERPALTQDLGLLLTPEVVFDGKDGVPPAIGPQMAGDLTRWMGLPWQCDVFSCQHVTLQEDFPHAVWWPASIPVNVLSERFYDLAMRSDLDAEQRSKFFHTRLPWSRSVPGIGYHANASYWDGISNMIALWERMGFVVKRPGPSDPDRPADLPAEIYVEVGAAETRELRFDWSAGHGMLP